MASTLCSCRCTYACPVGCEDQGSILLESNRRALSSMSILQEQLFTSLHIPQSPRVVVACCSYVPPIWVELAFRHHSFVSLQLHDCRGLPRRCCSFGCYSYSLLFGADPAAHDVHAVITTTCAAGGGAVAYTSIPKKTGAMAGVKKMG